MLDACIPIKGWLKASALLPTAVASVYKISLT